MGHHNWTHWWSWPLPLQRRQLLSTISKKTAMSPEAREHPQRIKITFSSKTWNVIRDLNGPISRRTGINPENLVTQREGSHRGDRRSRFDQESGEFIFLIFHRTPRPRNVSTMTGAGGEKDNKQEQRNRHGGIHGHRIVVRKTISERRNLGIRLTNIPLEKNTYRNQSTWWPLFATVATNT